MPGTWAGRDETWPDRARRRDLAAQTAAARLAGLAAVAHPDDETFGLGAVVDRFATSGAAVHLLCYTRGESSTVNETGASLRRGCSPAEGKAARHPARKRCRLTLRRWPGRGRGIVITVGQARTARTRVSTASLSSPAAVPPTGRRTRSAAAR